MVKVKRVCRQFLIICFTLLLGCFPALAAKATPDCPGVPKSSAYEMTVTENKANRQFTVFQSSCPEYRPGYMNMKPVDQYPFKRFQGRSISWANFPFSDQMTVHIRVRDKKLVSQVGAVKIFPSRFGVEPVVHGNLISFTLPQPGQYSVEIGDEGYQCGLVLFADPPETDKPDPVTGNYYIASRAAPAEINSVPATNSGIYFKSGLHNLGVYHVPANIKNIYLEAGAWVYGAMVIGGRSNVKIFGRGVLSGAKLNHRESHAVEAQSNTDHIDLEGIVLADTKFFAVRLLGKNNTVKWIKIVGGWTYNTDGIAAFAGSTVEHCFIWANDDSLKPYADNLRISDCVVWQLNNGAVIQLSWGNARATNVVIRNVDVLHAEWNNDAANRGVLSCIGDKFAKGGMSGLQASFLIENLVTETPVPFLFNLRPNPASPDQIHGLTFKNWDVKMDTGLGYTNHLECADATNQFDGLVFDNFKLNGIKLTEANWLREGNFNTKNIVTPVFK